LKRNIWYRPEPQSCAMCKNTGVFVAL